MENPPVKYLADLPHVREVTLHAAADLDYWKALLRPRGLMPREIAGRAALLFCTMTSRWLGLPFSELTVSVLVADPAADPPRDQGYLFLACNSSRLLAFCERKLFRTPYQSAEMRSARPDGVPDTLWDRGSVVMRLAFGARPAEQLGPTRPQHWEGCVYLPTNASPAVAGSMHFFACIEGATLDVPFDATLDCLELHSSDRYPAIRWLLDSHVTGVAWAIRPQARHARSKTYFQSSGAHA